MTSHEVTQPAQALGLTPFQLALVSILALFVILIFFIGILWLRRKYPQKSKLDPFTRAFIIIFGIDAFLVLSYAVVDIPSKEQLQKILPYSALAWILLVILFMIIIYWRKREIDTDVLWEYYVMPSVEKKWQGRIYKGFAYMPAYKFSKVINIRENPYIRQLADFTDKVEVFYGTFISHTKFAMIMVLNKYNGKQVYCHHNPTLDILIKFIGKEAESVYVDYGQEFEKGSVEPREEREVEIQRR